MTDHSSLSKHRIGRCRNRRMRRWEPAKPRSTLSTFPDRKKYEGRVSLTTSLTLVVGFKINQHQPQNIKKLIFHHLSIYFVHIFLATSHFPPLMASSHGHGTSAMAGAEDAASMAAASAAAASLRCRGVTKVVPDSNLHRHGNLPKNLYILYNIINIILSCKFMYYIILYNPSKSYQFCMVSLSLSLPIAIRSPCPRDQEASLK